MNWLADFNDIVKRDEPLAPHTWFRLGGPAECLAEPTSIDQLQALVRRCRDQGVPIRLLGGGSNILVRDEGVKGVVVRLSHSDFCQVSVSGQTIVAGGGEKLGHVISTSVREGLAGLEPLVGIPGTIGGALHGNAGSHGGDIGQWTCQATVMTRAGEIVERTRDELVFAYRESSLDELAILSARFELERDDPVELTKRMQKQWIVKKARQPLGHQSAGCIFKNPRGMSAGMLIEQAGLKNTRFGQAEVSDRHANFIVAEPGATSSDVLQLMELIRQRVADRLGIELETEIEIWQRQFRLHGGNMITQATRSPAEQFGLHKRRDGLSVALLAGGDSSERDVSLRSAAAVAWALADSGHRVTAIDSAGRHLSDIDWSGFDACFIALHGGAGEDGTVQQELESLGVAYTGSGPEASRLAMNKDAAKRRMVERGVPTPDWLLVYRDDSESKVFARFSDRDYPLVAKPNGGGSSLGFSIVDTPSQLPRALAEARRYDEHVIVEQCVRGREFTLAFIDDHALPLVEIVSRERAFTHEAKYYSQGTEFRLDFALDDAERLAVEAAATGAERAIGAASLSRVDLIVTPAGRPYILEVNTIPGMTGRSLAPLAARRAGLSMPQLCDLLVQKSLTPVSVGAA